MKKILKNPILTFILGAIIFSGITVAAYTITSNDVGYTPSDNTWEVDNIKDALDDLYKDKKLVKSGDIVYKESYSHTRYDELNQDLNAGKYICSYNYATPSYTIGENNKRVEVSFWDINVNGCDEYDEIYRKSYKTTPSSTFANNYMFEQFTGTINFNCKLNDAKRVSVKINGNNATYSCLSSNLICIPIAINLE